MAWSVGNFVDKIQRRAPAWVARVTVGDGQVQECLELKFPSEPTQAQALAAAAVQVAARNAYQEPTPRREILRELIRIIRGTGTKAARFDEIVEYLQSVRDADG